jgi:DNA-binding CsgD family transcriptional regulator
MLEQPLRRTGIDPVSNLPWGAHICLFYETPNDLIDIHSRYFGTGLEDGEFCIWALSDPITRDDAITGLGKAIPGFRRHLAEGHIELIDGYESYLPDDVFDAELVIGGWQARLADALDKGFAGLRLSGNAFWFETDLWKTFCEYEAEVDRSFEGRKMIALCTYPLQASRAVDMLNIARLHNLSIIRRNSHWEFFETPEWAENKREIRRLNGPIDGLPPGTGAPDILSKPFPGQENLTPRERIVLAQVLKGSSVKDAARELNISPRTIEFHRSNMMHKIGVHNVADLLGKVLRRE